MGIKKLLLKDFVRPEIEVHYAFQSTLKHITELHCHDFFEIFLITEGKVKHIINGTEQILNEGSLVFIRPNDVHTYRNLDKSFCCFINLSFPSHIVYSLFAYFGDCFDSRTFLEQAQPPTVTLSVSETEALKQKLQILNQIPLTDQAAKGAELRTLLCEIFARYLIRRNLQNNAAPDWLSILCWEMEKPNNFTEGLPALLRLSCKSHEHLCREMKKHLQKTPTEFINDLRLNYAANLLASTDLKITSIAFESGFENLSHFYHLFRTRYKMSPTDFRKSFMKQAQK